MEDDPDDDKREGVFYRVLDYFGGIGRNYSSWKGLKRECEALERIAKNNGPRPTALDD